MQFLRADTAATVLVGPFLDKTDGVTPETGITLGAADSAEIMKHDGTTFQDISSLTFTHKAHGMYTLAITAGFLDTEGRLTVFVSDESECLPVWAEYMVVNANVYDSLFAAATTDYLQVDAIQIGGDSQSATDLKDFADAGYDPGTNKVQGLVLADTVTTLTGHTAQTGDSFARIGATGSGLTSLAQASVCTETRLAELDSGNLPSDIDAILGDTNELQTDDVPGLIAALNNISTAQVNTEVDTALADLNLDHLMKIAVDTNFATTVHEDSVIGEIAQRGGANLWDRSTDSLEALRNTAPIGTTMRGTDNAALASVCTETRLAELDSGNLPSDIDAILADTGTDGVVLAADAITAAKIADDAISSEHLATGCLTADAFAADALVAATFATDSITSDALAASAIAEIWDATEAITGDAHSFETILARLYMFLQHKMIITDSTGNVALRDTGDSTDIMTLNIQDNDTLTTRTEAAWS